MPNNATAENNFKLRHYPIKAIIDQAAANHGDCEARLAFSVTGTVIADVIVTKTCDFVTVSIYGEPPLTVPQMDVPPVADPDLSPVAPTP